MKIYIYAKSGHNHELNAVRRCSVIEKALQEFDPLLCPGDFRAGAYAKDMLGIKKYVSMDVIENLPNMMQRGDILIFDSDEPSEKMLSHMKDFCTLLYEFGKDIPYTLIDTTIYNKQNANQKDEKVLFYGDNDYSNILIPSCENMQKQDIKLLMGHYFFLGNEKKLAPYFSDIIDEEEYVEIIQNTKYLLSGNENACLESLSCGNSPVLFLRDDIEYKYLDKIKELNIPIIVHKNLEDTISEFNQLIQNYPQTQSFENYDISKIVQEISSKIDFFKKINNI